MSARERELLRQRVNDLGLTEHREIFNILRRHNVAYTPNINGVFVNLSLVDAGVLQQISSYVDYCVLNKSRLDEYDKRRNECTLSHNYASFVAPDPSGTPGAADHAADPAPGGTADPGPTPDPGGRPAPPPAEEPTSLPQPIPSLPTIKRIVNSKFNLAKKKYARKKVVEKDRRADSSSAVASDLGGAGMRAEAYLL